MIALLVALVSAGGLRVELSAQASVRGTDIRLGEIASVSGADAATLARLSDYELGYAPAPGYSRFLRREQIASELARAFPGFTIEVAAGAGCRVEPLVETIAAERIEIAARSALVERLGGEDVEIALETEIASIEVPQGDAAAIVRATVRDPSAPSGTRAVAVEVLVDGAVYQTVWTSWKAEVWRSLPVLARDVRRGEALSPAVFEVRRIKLAAAPADEPIALELAAGALASRDLAAGSLMTARDVERPRVLAPGDAVHLEIVSGSIVASTIVVAQQDGRVGDRIRVVQPETGKELVALVRSAELVEIRMSR
jgi:flagella basal body P-ring formation protein FlgA